MNRLPRESWFPRPSERPDRLHPDVCEPQEAYCLGVLARPCRAPFVVWEPTPRLLWNSPEARVVPWQWEQNLISIGPLQGVSCPQETGFLMSRNYLVCGALAFALGSLFAGARRAPQ